MAMKVIGEAAAEAFDGFKEEYPSIFPQFESIDPAMGVTLRTVFLLAFAKGTNYGIKRSHEIVLEIDKGETDGQEQRDTENCNSEAGN